MKRLYIIIAAMIISISGIMAQPGPVQKMAKSDFTLPTFNKDGQIIASTQGVFIDNKGTAISTFKPFIGATKATIVDASGRSTDGSLFYGKSADMKILSLPDKGTTVIFHIPVLK